jgi:acetyl esterase/lipase/ubiquinone/menaquinone biosynthesis C-methylase UbiE
LTWFGSVLFSALLPGIAVAADDRQQWQQPDRVMQDLGLKAKARVADIGCGSGYFTFRLAQAVGPQGKVFAVDVSDKALTPVRQRIEREHLTNIEVILSAPRDTKIAPESVDAALLCIMLHDVGGADRLPLLQSTARALKPGGVLFLIDFARGRGVKFHTDEQLMSREDQLKLPAEAGLVLDAEFHYLKQQVFLRFRKPIGGLPPPVKPLVLDVWPGKVPGEVGTIGPEQAKTATQPDGTAVITSLTNVSKPTLTVCRPETSKNTGAAVLVFPGGGYNALAWDHEGEQVARWLNSAGIMAAVLKYRVPRREGTSKETPPIQALMDAQRAISLVRSKAAGWGVDPKRIGVLGFSAGGHLAAWSATNFDKRAYDKMDPSDEASCRPDFAVMIYPGGVVKAGTTELSPAIRVTPKTPPCFFAHAGDDRVSPENSVMMYLALKRAAVPAELHIYASGGHGFGLRPTGKPAATWPKRCEDWLRASGVIKADQPARR